MSTLSGGVEVTEDSVLLRRRFKVLVALTVFAGILRFAFLDRPAIWEVDVGATYFRVRGTFEQLVESLRETGFAPLHYEGTWVAVRWLGAWPWVMRLIPAICGVFMVPAMYFLARRMVSEKAALLSSAAIACCSAFLLGHSRDAKMYMDFWLMCLRR